MRSPAALLVLLLAASACRPAGRPESAGKVLPGYNPAEAVLFNDSLAPQIMRPGPWAPDAKLPERVRRADSVVIAKVVTITAASQTASSPSLRIDLLPVARPLAGTNVTDLLTFNLTADNPSYMLFRARARSLIGRRLVLLFRRYADESGIKLHFRAEPDVPEVHAAILRVGRD